MNHAKYYDALGGGRTAPNIERAGDTITVRTAPVARVAIPLTTAADLIANVMSTVVAGVPDLQRFFGEFGGRLGELVAKVLALAKDFKGETSSAGARK